MKPLSIQLYTVRDVAASGNHLAVLKEIAEIGYKGVEGGAAWGMDETEFRRVVEDLGMVVSSTWVPVPDSQENIDVGIAQAEALGTKLACGGFWIPEFESLDAIKAVADRLNFGLPQLRAAGLTYCLHNHWFEFEPFEGKLKIDHLLELCPDLQLEIDTYWATNFGANSAPQQVARLKDRATLLHVKDGPQVQGEPHVAVGSGSMDIPATLAAADPQVTQWLVVELDECATDMMAAVRRSHDYLVGNGLAIGNR